MVSSQRHISRVLGLIWAVVLLGLALALPPFGSWTIDDSVKWIAAENGRGIWADRMADGPIRASLAHPESNESAWPPFATRAEGETVIGFSPWTRALFKFIMHGGITAWHLVPAVIAILLWIALESRGIPYGFLLLPLTFYGLTAWEHGLSWLLSLPAIWLVATHTDRRKSFVWIGAGVLIAAAISLRPEAALLALILPAYLWFARYRRGTAALAGGALAGGIVLLLWYQLTGQGSAFIHLDLNSYALTDISLWTWLRDRADAGYVLLLKCDVSRLITLGMIIALFVSVRLLTVGERRKSVLPGALGILILLAWTAFYQWRLWTNPIPVLWLMQANSVLACLPWTILAVMPPYRNRPLLIMLLLVIGIAIVMVPVFIGVHWGPRILLFALPLAVFELHRADRLRGWAFQGLLMVTLLQSAGAATLVFARAREVNDRVVLARAVMHSPVICPTMSQCTDFAPLWTDREFFTAGSERSLRRLLCEMRLAGVDTVSLHLGVQDPLYEQTFPTHRPVTLVRGTLLQAKWLYATQWRIMELFVNPADTMWSETMEMAAGEWLVEGKLDDALRFQREAVRLSPNSAKARNNLALILAQLGRTEDARREAETAVALNPDLEQPRRLLEMLAADSANVPANRARP